jgi:hypothetical protein
LGAFDALNHLAGLFLPALAVGSVTAALAKLLWRRELRSSPWSRLALWAAGSSALVSLAGLAWFGRDGMMATYGAMIFASALTLHWVGFGFRR